MIPLPRIDIPPNIDFRINLPTVTSRTGDTDLATTSQLANTPKAVSGSRLDGGTTPGPRVSFMQVPQVFIARTGTRGRKPLHLPTVSLGNGVMRRYEAEKMYGIRRDTGAVKLKRLTRRHYEIIAMHLAGMSGEMIHRALNVSITTISRVLNDPLSQHILKKSYKDRQSELDALAGKAIGAVRGALDAGSTSEKLAAVDKYTKLKQAIAPESNPMETAEDFARALVTNATNVQINIGT